MKTYSFAGSVNNPTASRCCSQQDIHFISKEAHNSARAGILQLSIARRQKHRPRLAYSKLMAFVISVLALFSIAFFFTFHSAVSSVLFFSLPL
jgi:hypothetical protein